MNVCFLLQLTFISTRIESPNDRKAKSVDGKGTNRYNHTAEYNSIKHFQQPQ